MKFTLKNAHKFSWKGLKGFAYNSKEDFANASGAMFKVTGSHGRIKTTLSDRVYFVLAGEGEFEIDGQKISVKKHDMIIVPKNTPYNYRAKKNQVLELFLVHVPAFDPEAEVKLEDK